MTLLWGDEAYKSFAKARPVSSAFYSLLVHAAAAALLIWASLSPAVLKIPEHLRATMLAVPAPPPPPPPPPPAAAAVRAVRSVPSKFIFPTAKSITSPPLTKEIAIVEAPPALELAGTPGGVSGGVIGGVPGGVIGGVLGGFLPPATPPPEPAAKAPEARPAEPHPSDQPIQVSGEVQEAKLLVRVMPQYPPLARQARIQGIVRLSAIIDKDGKIVELKLLQGNPLLVDSALAAIGRWRYRPTFLNGQAVEVATWINVDFHLKQ